VRVALDIPLVVACRNVTTDEFSADHPQEKLIEATVHVSALVTAGKPSDVHHMLLIVCSPERRLRTVDFSPRTQLESDLVGPIRVERHTSQDKSLTAGIGGGVGLQYGIANVSAAPSASAGVTDSEKVKETYQRAPPRQLVLASGTVASGHGVFFKVKASPLTALEGDQQFVCRFAVPAAWRGDWARVDCRTFRRTKEYFQEKIEPCGTKSVLVGFYLIGDEDARAAAQQLAAAQTVRATTQAVASRKTTSNSKHHASHHSFEAQLTSASAALRPIGEHLGLHRVFRLPVPSGDTDPPKPSPIDVARQKLADLSGANPP